MGGRDLCLEICWRTYIQTHRGGGARFLRLLSYFATFALVIGTFLPFMSKLAYSEGTLSYEIRATFITSDPSSDNLKIKIKEDPQAEISQAGAGDSEEDGDVGDVQEINSKYSKCRVVFTVTSSNSSLYTAGKKITCVWTSSDSAPDDPQNCGQEVEIRKDQKTGDLYSDVTFRETSEHPFAVSIVDVDEPNKTLTPKEGTPNGTVFLKGVPFTVNSDEKKLNVVSSDESSTNLQIPFWASINDYGNEILPEPSVTILGTPVTLNGTSYRIEHFEPKTNPETQEPITLITLKKAPVVPISISYPVSKSGFYKFCIKSDTDTTYRVIYAKEGDKTITFNAAINGQHTAKALKVEPVSMNKGEAPLWDADTMPFIPDFDVKTNTLSWNWPKNRILITPIYLKEGFSYSNIFNEFVNAESADMAKMTVTLTPVGAETTSTKPLVSSSYDKDLKGLIVDNVVPGTYNVTFSSNDPTIRQTYDLTGEYRIVHNADDTYQIDHLASPNHDLWYAPGTKNVQDAGLYPGRKTRLMFAIPQKMKVEKLVRNTSSLANASFASSAKAKAGDEVEYQLKVTLPRDYHLLWKNGDDFVIGSEKPMRLADTLNSHLALDEKSVKVADGKDQAVTGITHEYDTNKRELIIKDTRAAQTQDIRYKKGASHEEVEKALKTEYKLRENEEVIYIRYKAKVNDFPTDGVIKNTVGESTAKVEETTSPSPAPTPTPEPPVPEPTPEPPAPEPTPTPEQPAPAPEPTAPAPAAPAEPTPEPVKPEPAAPQQAPQRKAIPQTSDATTPMQTQAGALAVIALLLCAFGTAYRVRRSA